MKIFGKRTKGDATKTSNVDAGPENQSNNDDNGNKKSFASDPVVQELLKKDSSEWNAKEKRMVKRFQQRNAMQMQWNRERDDIAERKETDKTLYEAGDNHDNSSFKDEHEDEDEEESSHRHNSRQEKSEHLMETKASSKGDPPSISLDLESVLDASMIEALNAKQRRKLSRTLAMHGASSVKDVVDSAKQIINGDAAVGEEKDTQEGVEVARHDTQNEDDGMDQVKQLLQGLNSKQKRKLSRRLEREGNSCLAEVKAEAEALLKAPSSTHDQTLYGSVDSSSPPPSKKRKRRRGPEDVTGLTPEERLRREEQRKMQKEAAERRISGDEDTAGKFRHPLNSERRRANRRKPKWAPKIVSAVADKIEHNTSGFLVRKRKSTEQVS